MTDNRRTNYRRLRDDEVRQLKSQGCSAVDWGAVQVAEPFLVDRYRAADFAGNVRVGSSAGDIERNGAPAKPCGIYNARLQNCVVGDGTRIANVGRHLAGYHIGNRVLIENIGIVEAHAGATFGNGVEVSALNEAGGREVPLFNSLSSQFAYLVCVYRYRTELLGKLLHSARREVEDAKRDFGSIEDGAAIVGVPKLVDVNVGLAASIDSAQSLVNGTILSHPDAPTIVGDAVIAKNFILAEGAQVSGGAIIHKSFIGQACRVGNQFSAENSLFFANCEAFHGEAVSVFAGPYTVTHHKSTLLIGGMFSFYNTGSGTNQSNHRYKLGPTHEGKLERGCKTGSFAYVMWPCRVGPFSVVLGKHTRSFDTADLPFSHLEADGSGKCELIPGHYIATVGTLRDGLKWPKRDRRMPLPAAGEGPGNGPRDILCFEVFNPMTVGRMLAGAEKLSQLQESTNRSVVTVNVGGADIKRVLLRMGAKRYTGAIERYLLEQIFLRMEQKLSSGAPLKDVFMPDVKAVYSKDWLDIGGQLLPRTRLEHIAEEIVNDKINTVADLQRSLLSARNNYGEDVWLWCRNQAPASLGVTLDEITVAKAQELVARFSDQQQKFLRLVLIDAEREYDESSRIGFGMDGDAAARNEDFAAVRGTLAENSFVKELHAEIESTGKRCQIVRERLATIG
ncbi:MAG TPA: DUF4954 family protein [Lacipirellulaceae bacterium]|nr:DUF4954 family protein [Lacipirellulaceae bacterium]